MPKKILLVSRCAWTLFNFRSGLIRALRNDGYQVIGGGAGGDGFEEKIQSLGIPFVPLPVDKKGINLSADIKLFYKLYQWYRNEKPDLVHHFTIKPVIYGSIAARLARVPKIINTITGLGFIFMEENIIWLRRLVEWQYRVALLCSDFTFFLNKEDRDFFMAKRLIKIQKTGLLPGEGVDTGFFSPRPSSDKQQLNYSFTFLMTARLLREKGIYEYVEAAQKVKAQFPNIQFQLLGKRDERNPTVIPQKDIDTWQSKGLVQWLGETEDVRPFLSQSDVVVLPTYREGLSRSLLEASAMGKPIIASDVVGCREVVDHHITGLLVPMKDSNALAQAMIWMIKHPERQSEMGEAGRSKIKKQFDEQIVINKILDIYKSS